MQPVNFVQQWKEDVLSTISGRKRKIRLKWLDDGKENEVLDKEKIVTSDPSKDLIHKVDSIVEPVKVHKEDKEVKKILKVSKTTIEVK